MTAIGMAQVAVANKRWSDWESATKAMGEGVHHEPDAKLVLRALGLLPSEPDWGGGVTH